MSPGKSEMESLATPNRQRTSEVETLHSSMSGNETTCIDNHEVQQEKLECIGSPTLENLYRVCSDETSSSPKKDHEIANVARDCLNNCQSCAEQVQAEAISALELPGTSHFGEFLDIATTELRTARVETLEKDSNSHLYFEEAANAIDTGNSDFVASPKLKVLKDDNIDHTKDAVASFKSISACDAVDFANTSEDPLVIQEESAARFVSTNLEGWHRFDSDESGANGVLGIHQALYGAPQKRLELWEQLLEDDVLEDSAQYTSTTIEPVKAEAIIESSIPDGNQFWLASPGNPFIEGLPRSSNFSETDGFITEANSERSNSRNTHVVDALADTGLDLSDKACKRIHSGTRSDVDKSAEEIMGSHTNGMTDGGKKVFQQRFPSFSDLRRSSSRPRDSSFPSFKEQEPFNPSLKYENGGEKWEAIFDSVEPAIHEGQRSSSFPREANNSHNEASFVDLGTSHSKLSTFLASPKLSPIVKKVASKVRTNQSKVKNVVCDTKPSKDSDKKNSRNLTWRCCICCTQQS